MCTPLGTDETQMNKIDKKALVSWNLNSIGEKRKNEKEHHIIHQTVTTAVEIKYDWGLGGEL